MNDFFKRGQITVFIILGIVILFTTVFVVNVYFFKGGLFKFGKIKQFDVDANNFENHVISCIKQVGMEGIEKLGLQGGYTNVPDNVKFENTSLWYLDQINIQPVLGNMKLELQTYIDEKLPDCLSFKSFTEKGFTMKREKPKSNITFDSEGVFLFVNYPITIKKTDFRKDFNQFVSILDVRFRKAFELASQIINRQLEPDFNFSSPLEKLQKFDFNIKFSSSDNESIVYEIIESKDAEEIKPFVFRFASQFGINDLKRTVELHEQSSIIPTSFPFVVYSVDKMAQLIIMPGTKISIKGRDISNISVRQFYMLNATLKNVPFIELADNSVINKSITWILDYPVYEFNPIGAKFNTPQKLLIYWDEDKNPSEGGIGLLYTDGKNWRPLRSFANYTAHFIATDIPGFSKVTPIKCNKQPRKEVSVTAQVDPGGDCWGDLLLRILVIYLIIAIAIAFASPFTWAIPGGVFFLPIFLLMLIILVPAVYMIGDGTLFDVTQLYRSDADSITFTPTCAQNVTIQKDSKGAAGFCMPKAYRELKAGEPHQLVSFITKCKGARKYLCQKCSLTCKLSYI